MPAIRLRVQAGTSAGLVQQPSRQLAQATRESSLANGVFLIQPKGHGSKGGEAEMGSRLRARQRWPARMSGIHDQQRNEVNQNSMSKGNLAGNSPRGPETHCVHSKCNQRWKIDEAIANPHNGARRAFLGPLPNAARTPLDVECCPHIRRVNATLENGPACSRDPGPGAWRQWGNLVDPRHAWRRSGGITASGVPCRGP